MNHIEHAIVAKTHTPLYLMHKYWARKPHNVVSAYIKKYSKKGEIVLDPFCGSGVTVIETLKLGRKAIALDVDPMAIFITKMTAVKTDVDELRETFKEIEQNVKARIHSFYKTTCRKCGNDVITTHIIWKKEKKLKKDTFHKIWYLCKNCGDKTFQRVDPVVDDFQLLDKVENMKPLWYPDNELVWNSRVNVHKGMKVSDLFTKRALIGLSLVYNEIENIKNENVREMMKFVFSSALSQASNLVFVIEKRGRQTGDIKRTQEVGSWATRGYWIPPKHFEINVWNCFENRYKRVLRGKESNSMIEYKEARGINDLGIDSNVFLANTSVLDMSRIIPSNSVDYIFADPPYGDAVPYLELNCMWASWMKFPMNFEDEIVVSDSPLRGKTDEIYEKMLNAAFVELFNVLKPGRYMTVTFHNTKIKYWNSLIKAVVLAGFKLEKIIYQPPARVSPKGLLHPFKSAIGDYYIRFRKPQKGEKCAERKVDKKGYELIVVKTAKRLIAERGEPIPYQFILNGIIPALDKYNVLLEGDKEIEDIMREHLRDEFTLVDVTNEKGDIIGHKWWLKNPSAVPYVEIPLHERIEKAVITLLDRKKTFYDILQEIFARFPNSQTPDTHTIVEILKEYAKKTKDGKWQLKQTKKYMDSLHTEMIYYLATIGKRLGFNVYIGQREQDKECENVKLSALCSEESPTLRVVSSEIERIKHIDVIWYNHGEITYAFEVESTTSITEAIVRGSHISTETTKRYIVIPKEREKFLYKRLQESIFEKSRWDKWNFMFYKDVKELFRHENIKIKDIHNVKIPRLTSKEQKTMVDYF